jgi:hypothetical protein
MEMEWPKKGTTDMWFITKKKKKEKEKNIRCSSGKAVHSSSFY